MGSCCFMLLFIYTAYFCSLLHIFLPVMWLVYHILSLAKFNKFPPSPTPFFNQQSSPAFKSVSLCFVLERHVFLVIKVQALTWIYLKQITGTDRFLMLLSKLDQRCEAAFVHIRIESSEMRRGGGEGRTALFVGWYLEKQKPVSRFVSPLWSLSLLLSLPPSVIDLPCVEYIICQRLFHIRPALIYQWHDCLCLCPLYR